MLKSVPAGRGIGVVVLVAGVALGGAGIATARIAGGHGKAGDCYAEFDNIDSNRKNSGQPRVDCTAGDPACADPTDCHNTCTFKVGVCINQHDIAGCNPPAQLTKLKALPAKYRTLVDGLDKTQSMCRPTFVDVVVKTRSAKMPGRQQLRLFATAPRGTTPAVDSDVVTLYCHPRAASDPCPTTTTTSTTTTSTTLAPPIRR